MATASLQLNSANDLYLPDGKNLVVLTGVAACSQDIRQATLMRIEEDIYNVLSGVDYLGSIFTPQPNEDYARKSIASAILACPDVISIEYLSITILKNSFNYVALVNTVYGPITASNQ